MIPTTEQVLAKLRNYPRDLTWASFRRVKAAPNPNFQAQTSAGYVRSGYQIQLIDGEYRLSGVRVTVNLNQTGTWVLNNSGVMTADLLKHEQGHFDIVGLIARDLCRGLLSLAVDAAVLAATRGVGSSAHARLAAASTELNREVRRLDQAATDLMHRLQSHRVNGVEVDGQYDVETNHGQTATAQQKWNDIFRHARENDTSLSLTLMIFNT